MKRSERLGFIVELAARQEQEALENLGSSQRKLNDLLQQLQQLQSYRTDYRTQFDRQQRQGIAVDRLLELRAFSERLDQAIDSQQQTTTHQERELQRLRSHWLDKRRHRQALDNLRQQALRDEASEQARREQQETDARALRVSRKRGTTPA